MSNIEEVQHIINFLRDNEIETGNKRGVEPLEDMLKENKELNLENQALYESINCNDDNMLARRYEKLQKENEILKGTNEDITSLYLEMKDKIKAKIKELEKVKNIDQFSIFTEAKIEVLEELLEEN